MNNIQQMSLENNKVIVTFNNGKSYALEAVLKRRERDLRWLEVRDDQTQKREWWRAHVVSRDMPNSKAARADYSDCGKAVARMIAAIDRTKRAPTEAERNRAIIDAAIYIAKTLGYSYRSAGYLEILTIISTVAIYRNEAREILMTRLNLSYHAYIQRLTRYSTILEARVI